MNYDEESYKILVKYLFEPNNLKFDEMAALKLYLISFIIFKNDINIYILNCVNLKNQKDKI